MLSNITFHSTKQIWIDRVPQYGGTLVRSCYLRARRIGVSAQRDGDRKVLHEDGQCSQSTGKDEIEQGPQFLQVVLQRRSRENDSVRGWKFFDCERNLSVRVPDLMTLVQDDVIEVLLEQVRLVGHETAEASDQHAL